MSKQAGLFKTRIYHVAVPTPQRKHFDYLPPKQLAQDIQCGCRVMVPFNNRRVVGVVIGCSDESQVPLAKLKRIEQLIDTQAVLPPNICELLMWSAEYYQHPLGEVFHAALPGVLRQGKALPSMMVRVYRIKTNDAQQTEKDLQRAPRQRAVFECIAAAGSDGLTASQLDERVSGWQAPLRQLLKKALLECVEREDAESEIRVSGVRIELSAEQQAVVDAMHARLDEFHVALLEGVTGSGKTEVYLECIRHVLLKQQQVLVLVPEIGLTPQLVTRFQQRLGVPIGVLHSGLTETERAQTWQAAASGTLGVIVGTRSAVFTPMPRLGLIIIDEEHDASYKQQEGFRYSARDVAIRRAQKSSLPVILGSATPSLESLQNASQQRYHLYNLPSRFGEAVQPTVKLIDLRHQPLQEGMTQALMDHMQRHLQQGNQVLLFLNRRGFAPTLLCHECGWVAGCERCDSHLVVYQRHQRLRCQHCAADKVMPPRCPQCNSEELISLGQGTERIADFVELQFGHYGVVRIDRDTTRRKGAFDAMVDSVMRKQNNVLIGTQMLAKGHHFPDVTLVGILNVDQGLFSADFRAIERTAQLIVQVAGRAGRALKPGEVIIQTHMPEHPLLRTLLQQGYNGFAHSSLQERRKAVLPPYSYLALLRAEAVAAEAAMSFLGNAKSCLGTMAASPVDVFGPVPAPMEKRAGRYRAQLLLQARDRKSLHDALAPWLQRLESDKLARKVRWSLDVDPIEMF